MRTGEVLPSQVAFSGVEVEVDVMVDLRGLAEPLTAASCPVEPVLSTAWWRAVGVAIFDEQ